MKTYLLTSLLAVSVLFLGCKKEDLNEGGNDEDNGTKNEIVTLKAAAAGTYTWQKRDAFGLFTSDDTNEKFTLKEGEGTASGIFEGKMSELSTIIGAYLPYSAEAGKDMTAIKVNIPTEVTQSGENTPTASFALASVKSDGSLEFAEKLAKMKISFSGVAGSSFENAALTSLTVKSARNFVGDYKASVASVSTPLESLNTASGQLKLTFTDTKFVDGIVGYAGIAPTLKGSDKLKIILNLDGTDVEAEIDAPVGIAEGEIYEIVIEASLFEPGIELVWSYGGVDLPKFSSHVPSVDASGNVYFTNESKMLTKVSSSGELLWSEEIGYASAKNAIINPSIDTDGTVYVGGGEGNGTNACFTAFNPDGTKKWTITGDKFFGNGSTPSPNLSKQYSAAIGTTHIYIGNAGTTGTVLAIDKNTGERTSYVSGKTDGTGGPAGGVNSGMALTKGGVVSWFANYGLFGANVSSMGNPDKTHATFGGYVPYGLRAAYKWSWSNSNGGIACTNIGGEDHLVAFGIEKTTSNTYNMHVFAAKSAAGLNSDCPGASQDWTVNHKIENVKLQDQGGVVIGANGEIIVPLKNNDGDGGLYAVGTDGKKAWQYKVGADVCGAAAVDNNGYVHFVDDNAVYHIIKPNTATGECEEVAKADLYELVKKSTGDLGTISAARAWTSVVIGEDGRMYVAAEFRESWSALRHGRLLCLSYEPCTGLNAASPWPMKYADARHTCNQK